MNYISNLNTAVGYFLNRAVSYFSGTHQANRVFLPLERSKYCDLADPNPIVFTRFWILERLFNARTAFFGITNKLAVLTTKDVVGVFMRCVNISHII